MGLLNVLPEVDSQGWPWTEETDGKIYDTFVSWPKISIVTPSYNQGIFIEETIRSVLLQNYPNLEYIIIDGGSNDNTREIIKKYEPWVTYWISEPDRGQSHAINKGIEKCTGDIFNWINSDDWYTRTAFFNVADNFLRKAFTNVISGFENHISINGNISLFKGTFVEKNVEESIELSYISQPSTFFRLSVFKQLGTLSEDLHYCMDSEMWIRFLLIFGTNSFFKINKSLVNFRFHQGSKTVNNLDGDSLSRNFLFEKSSIITDLMRHVEAPIKIREYWINEVFETSTIYNLNRGWQINNEVTSVRLLRLYFLKRYINLQFQNKNFEQASWGMQELYRNNSIGLFTLKSLIKLVLKKLSN